MCTHLDKGSRVVSSVWLAAPFIPHNIIMLCCLPECECVLGLLADCCYLGLMVVLLLVLAASNTLTTTNTMVATYEETHCQWDETERSTLVWSSGLS